MRGIKTSGVRGQRPPIDGGAAYYFSPLFSHARAHVGASPARAP